MLAKARQKFFRANNRHVNKSRKTPKECRRNRREPLYGFRVKVKLVDNERCTLDVTCTRDGQKIGQSRATSSEEWFEDKNNGQFVVGQFSNRKFADRQFGDRQFSDRQFDDRQFNDRQFENRQFIDGQFTNLHFDDGQFADRQFADRQFADRQTGENFLSAAPVDCRTTTCSNP
jgi:hypothetical protein